jgi:hypothetical protein
MKILTLPAETREQLGYTHKIVIDYTDLTALTSGSAYSIFPKWNNAATFPIGTQVADVAANVATAFTFAAGTLVFKVGDGGDSARFIAASTDLKTAGYVDGVITKRPYTYIAADTIDITITCGAGTPATIAAGSLEVYLRIREMDTLQRPT